MEPSGLTSEMIRDEAIRQEIQIHLRPDETKESVLKKFNGDLVKTIIFLRDRSYGTQKKKSEYPPEHILNPIHDPPYSPEQRPTKPVSKKKKPAPKGGQAEMF